MLHSERSHDIKIVLQNPNNFYIKTRSIHRQNLIKMSFGIECIICKKFITSPRILICGLRTCSHHILEGIPKCPNCTQRHNNIDNVDIMPPSARSFADYENYDADIFAIVIDLRRLLTSMLEANIMVDNHIYSVDEMMREFGYLMTPKLYMRPSVAVHNDVYGNSVDSADFRTVGYLIDIIKKPMVDDMSQTYPVELKLYMDDILMRFDNVISKMKLKWPKDDIPLSISPSCNGVALNTCGLAFFGNSGSGRSMVMDMISGKCYDPFVSRLGHVKIAAANMSGNIAIYHSSDGIARLELYSMKHHLVLYSRRVAREIVSMFLTEENCILCKIVDDDGIRAIFATSTSADDKKPIHIYGEISKVYITDVNIRQILGESVREMTIDDIRSYTGIF